MNSTQVHTEREAGAQTIEISIKGKWYRVPALFIDETPLIVRSGFVKTAIVEAEEWLSDEIQDPELCIRALKDANAEGKFTSDIFTFSQKVPNAKPRYSYPLEWESIAVADVSSFKQWWEGLPQESRKNVRRSERRGVEVRVEKLSDALIESIMGVNNDSPVRQGKPYTHYGKTFAQVVKDQESFPDRSVYICAYVQDELIGFLKLILRNGTASILQILPKISHADKRPANALIAEAVRVCEERGISTLVYGKFNYGNGDNSLREFKSRNGFLEVMMPRYYVPLTAKGALALKANLHHGVRGWIPGRVLSMLVNVRAKWYDYQIRRCSSIVERSNRNRQTERSNPPAGSTP